MSDETVGNLYLGAFFFVVMVVVPLAAEILQRQRQKQHYQSWVDHLNGLRPALDSEAKEYLARFGHLSDKPTGMTIVVAGVQVLDLTSDKEKQLAQSARDGDNVGPAFDSLVAELREIGMRSEFAASAQRRWRGSSDFEEGYNKQARRIGELLHQAGGMSLMKAAYYRVKAAGADARDLERCWHGIGEWRG